MLRSRAMPINGLASIQLLSHDSTGQVSSNTFHVVDESQSTPPDLGHLQGIANDFHIVIQAAYPGMLPTTSSWDSITVRQVRDNTVTPKEALLEYSRAEGVPGTRSLSANLLPRQACALLQLRSVVASRRFRSHLFMPPAFNQAAVTGDMLTGTGNEYWNAVNNFRAALASGLASATARWSGSTLSNFSVCSFSNAAQLQHVASVALTSAVVIAPDVRWLRSRRRGTT